MTGRSQHRWRVVVAPFLAAAVFFALLMTADDIGFARDEGFYYEASLEYQTWFDELFESPVEAMTQERIDQSWQHNREHPALMKTLFGFSWRWLHRDLGLLSPSTALRLPAMVFAAFCVWLTVLWGWRLGGAVVGVTAGVLLVAQPRFFYHAHLACFDIAVASMWLATVYAYWRSQSSQHWAWITGVAFGLCLCTKLNAFFIPPVLLVHHVFMYSLERRRGGAHRPAIPFCFFTMALVGVILFFVHWPWIWHETAERVGFYIAFHRAHPYYNMEYFGRTYFEPPLPVSFPFVMTALTLPLTTLVLALIGVSSRGIAHVPSKWLSRFSLRPRSDASESTGHGADLLIVLCAMWPLLIIAWPTVPIFGGTKHWLPAIPFIALFAGFGMSKAVQGLASFCGGTSRRRSTAVVAVTAGLLLAPALHETASSHPFALTHYNVLAGGSQGAADLGLNRQYWGYTTRSLLDFLNEHVEPDGQVFFHDTAHAAYRMYIDDGALRRDILWGDTSSSQLAIVHHEQHMAHVEYEIWERFDVTAPVHVVSHQGVPVISVYQRRDSGRTGEP